MEEGNENTSELKNYLEWFLSHVDRQVPSCFAKLDCLIKGIYMFTEVIGVVRRRKGFVVRVI